VDFGRTILLAAIVLAGAPRSRAQSQAGVAAPPAFEVASVKPNKSGDRAPWRFAGSRGGITATNVTLQFLITNAYDVRDHQISGGPSWLNSERYDIVAKGTVDNPTPAKNRQMLKTLLADRFQLRLRRESKELPVYALVVGKNGPKFHEADGATPGGMNYGRGRITARKASMEDFAKRLESELGRTVVNRTALKGDFAFEMEWIPDTGSTGPVRPRQTLLVHPSSRHCKSSSASNWNRRKARLKSSSSTMLKSHPRISKSRRIR